MVKKLHELLQMAVERHASDLHLMASLPPVLRINGEIIITDLEPMTAVDTDLLILENLSDEHKEKLKQDLQLCYSLTVPDIGYFRVSIYYEQGTLGASIRVGMSQMKTLEELGLPDLVAEFTRRPSGLVLITGPTGSGKTTTLNAMVDVINRERRCKIIMVEDPIEYIHSNKRSIIVQQEVYTDTHSFYSALRHILRQDPDVIGLGEMRDLDTISAALTAAETGHLVLSTLHTPSAPQTVHRIVDVFPADQQDQVRMQLASSLEAIISQRLLPRVDKPGRVLATEFMIATPAVRNIIRENKIQGLASVLQTGQASGMHSMDMSLTRLYQRGIITYDTAVSCADDPTQLRQGDAATAGRAVIE